MYNDGCSVTGKTCTCGSAGFCVACVEAREDDDTLRRPEDEWCKTCRLAPAETATGQCMDCFDYQYAASDKPSEPWHKDGPHPKSRVRAARTPRVCRDCGQPAGPGRYSRLCVPCRSTSHAAQLAILHDRGQR